MMESPILTAIDPSTTQTTTGSPLKTTATTIQTRTDVTKLTTNQTTLEKTFAKTKQF
jgi:hypothetical protein